MAFYVSRFREIEQREYEYEVVTPLFLGGADPKKAELRAAPIKGALRFWWRALHGSDNIEAMKNNEDKIFGSTEGKAVVLVKLDRQNIRPILKDMPQGKKIMVTSKSKGNSLSRLLTI